MASIFRFCFLPLLLDSFFGQQAGLLPLKFFTLDDTLSPLGEKTPSSCFFRPVVSVVPPVFCQRRCLSLNEDRASNSSLWTSGMLASPRPSTSLGSPCFLKSFLDCAVTKLPFSSHYEDVCWLLQNSFPSLYFLELFLLTSCSYLRICRRGHFSSFSFGY